MAVAASFLVSVLVVLPAAEGQGSGVAIDDDTGDVQLCPAGQGTCNASPDASVVEYIDLTQVVFGKETGNNITVEFTVAGMDTSPPSMSGTMQTVLYLACFKWQGTQFGVSTGLKHTSPESKQPIPGLLFVPTEECSFASATTPALQKAVASIDLGDAGVDLSKNLLWIQIQRKTLGELRAADGGDGSTPKPGQTLEELTGGARGIYSLFNREVVTAQDLAGPGGPFTFTAGTANELLEIRVKTNTVDRGLRVPEYSVDAGGFQAVPVEILNRAPSEKTVLLNATLIDGDKAKWSFSIVPKVKVPAMRDGAEGLRIVTLVVEPKGGVKHLDAAKLRIAAAFEDDAGAAGAIDVNVKAIYSPSPESPRMWFHFGLRPGMSSPRPWMNTLQNDPMAYGGDDARWTPNGESGGTFTAVVDPDVQPGKDLILDALSAAVLHMNLSATGEAEVGYVLFIENGDRVVAQGDGSFLLSAADAAAPQHVKVDMPVVPVSRDDTEVRVEAGVGKGLRLVIRMDPRSTTSIEVPQVGELPVGASQPSVTFDMTKTSLTLPILRTEAPGLTNISQSGARISLNLLEQKDLHVNPGKTRVLNFTVLNEGVKDDTITVKLGFDRAQNWRVALRPTDSFRLPPGEGAEFALFVAPPLDAEEESTFLLEVVAASKVDATVVSKLRYEFTVTRGVEFDDEGGLGDAFKKKGSKKGKLPGFEGLAAIAAVGAALLVAGRRRHGE